MGCSAEQAFVHVPRSDPSRSGTGTRRPPSRPRSSRSPSPGRHAGSVPAATRRGDPARPIPCVSSLLLAVMLRHVGANPSGLDNHCIRACRWRNASRASQSKLGAAAGPGAKPHERRSRTRAVAAHHRLAGRESTRGRRRPARRARCGRRLLDRLRDRRRADKATGPNDDAGQLAAWQLVVDYLCVKAGWICGGFGGRSEIPPCGGTDDEPPDQAGCGRPSSMSQASSGAASAGGGRKQLKLDNAAD
jgi:hypothetical protein